MDHELLCNWLGLATKTWPPDHYTLLGLDPREADCAQIEQRVHEQLARIRCYQLSHPALATEAMNRLAQALLCLTDRDARKAYDAQVLPNRLPRVENPPPVRALKPKTQAVTRTAQAVVDQPPAQAQTPASSNVDTAVVPPKQTQVDWKDATPPPVRTVTPAPPPVANPTPASPPAAAEQQPPPPAAPAAVPRAQPADPVFEAARSSPVARRGLGTRRGLYQRVLTTRRLLRAWDRIGKYAGKSKRKLTRDTEENELVRQLARIEELLPNFPPLLGEPGQPGYRVIVLVHDDGPVAMFDGMGTDEREALALDWTAGRALLQAHRDFLRRELKKLHRQGWGERLLRAPRAALNDHPGWVYLGLLLVIAAATTVIVLS